MRKFIALTLAIVVVFPSFAHAQQRGPCDQPRFLRITPKESSPELITALIGCATRRWDVPGGKVAAVRIAKCESSLWPFAHSNGNYGVFQQRGIYWAERVSTYLSRDWFNLGQWDRIRKVPQGPYIARANVLLSVRMARQGWGDWSCGA